MNTHNTPIRQLRCNLLALALVITATASAQAQPEPALAPDAAPGMQAVAPTPRISLSADALFAYEKSTLSPIGKKQLDFFAAQLTNLQYEFMTVTGHTDRLGEHVHNVYLSEQRAQVVGDYLMEVLGLPADKLLVRGQNGSNAMTQPGECLGTQISARLIACLQKDRRVDVDVTGTR